MIRFYNTLSGRLEEFRPLREGEVKIYTCGPTVYDYAHIGNFRAFVFEDLLRRFLEFEGFKVKHVMNLTDVDDKTIAGATREEKKLDDFTEVYTQAFQEDLKTLNILPPNHPAEQPRATREIPAMIKLIEKLVQKGAAYVSDGSVYYRVAAFPGYGKLSKKKLEQNITGVRVDVDSYEKEEGADFALWKKAKEGEPAWDSPWGKGRPGWHIECSAMSMKYLGETFDIHAGGEDLIFPHHENEIAQSEAATGKLFVRYWLHCKFLLVDGEKMSKSKGNFYTLRDLLAKGNDPMAIRYALLSVHYRQPLNLTLQGLADAADTIKKLDDCYFQCLSYAHNIGGGNSSESAQAGKLQTFLAEILKRMAEALEDDLNVSASLAAFMEGVKEINRAIAEDQTPSENMKEALNFFRQSDQLYGLDVATEGRIPKEVIHAVQERNEIRGSVHFAKDKGLQQQSDRLREKIHASGWLVKDGRPGEPSTVKRKRRIWDLK
jgi:cysteinyl-tRNA synthetase